jgi:signal transduction histidine kinase
MREQIFEKYGQVRATARKGTGLGLTFCRLVVEAHGGRIGVRDAPNRGSIFWFRLPIDS